jgi:deoxyribonuclease-1
MVLALPTMRKLVLPSCYWLLGACDKDGAVKLPREVKTLAQLGETVARNWMPPGQVSPAAPDRPQDKVALSALVHGERVGHRDFTAAKRIAQGICRHAGGFLLWLCL